MYSRLLWFQSSPNPKVGCHTGDPDVERDVDMFQSSPNPKVGCHRRLGGWTPIRRCSFNPHPTRRLGAITAKRLHLCLSQRFNPHPTRRLGAIDIRIGGKREGGRFQSSPNPKVGCHLFEIWRKSKAQYVSILTQPEGWVPCESERYRRRPNERFQSSPNPKVGCHKSRRLKKIHRRKFQSSPNPKVGCHMDIFIASFDFLHVSILTQPEGWVP